MLIITVVTSMAQHVAAVPVLVIVSNINIIKLLISVCFCELPVDEKALSVASFDTIPSSVEKANLLGTMATSSSGILHEHGKAQTRSYNDHDLFTVGNTVYPAGRMGIVTSSGNGFFVTTKDLGSVGGR